MFGSVVRRLLLLAMESQGQEPMRCAVSLSFCYTESATFNKLPPPRWAPVRIIVGCAPSIRPLALAASSAASSSAAPSPSAPASPSALTVGSISSGVGSSGRSPGENLGIGIIGAGILWLLVFGQRS